MTPAGYALIAVCVVTVAALVVLFVLRPSWRRRGGLLRFGVAAALAATVSSLMYLVHSRSEDLASLVIGDVAMVLAPGFVFAGLGALGGGMSARVALVGIVAIAVGVVSAVAPLPTSLSTKALALAALCAAGAVATRHPALAARRGSRLLSAALGCYGVFSASRVVVGLTAGWQSSLYETGFSIFPTTIVGGVAVLVIGTAVVMIVSDRPDDAPTAAVPAVRHPEGAPAWSVTLGALDVLRTALGASRATRMSSDLLAATREIDPAAVSDAAGAGTRLRTDHDRQAIERSLRARLVEAGWSPGELGLLSVERES
ncbi:hypothetical protein [Microbacterium sp. cf332]|uniref:hypothetical protein n=1 Tax=Microbacterium sp. cf332 TaxID=1761804 RepID=UPI00088B6FEC|nr:hypothetical protein [Microbacterium sp. cf332]SDQ32153.1 hypothetical protein SAMN04487847_1405 [Microbacterium sp. cf332]